MCKSKNEGGEEMDDGLVIGIITPNDFKKRLPFGGGSGFILNLINYLKASVTIFGAGANGTILWTPYSVNKNTVFLATYPFTFPSKSLPLRLTAFFGYLKSRKQIINSDVDLLYIHSPECALPFLFGKHRKPVVFHQHGSGNPVVTSKYIWARNSLLVWVFDKIHQLIYKRANWIIAIDRLCQDQANNNGAAGKVSLLMNAVDTKQFRPDANAREQVRHSYNLSNSETVLLFVGRIEEVKQVDKLIKAFALLRTNISAQLFIAGDGSLRTVLEKQVGDSKLNNSVHFMGKVSHDELCGLYNMADMLVLPSKMEGVPMVILESLACGTPVVATAVGGIPDLINNGENGFLIDDVSIETLADALERTAKVKLDPVQVSSSIQEWSAPVVADKLSKVFKHVIE